MKKFTSCIRSKANGLALRARMALSNQRGDFYISDEVKIIIAVVPVSYAHLDVYKRQTSSHAFCRIDGNAGLDLTR